MTHISYKSHEEMTDTDYEYIMTVADDIPENLDINEINDFLNDIMSYEPSNHDDYCMADFDDYDIQDIMKGLR
jgi:hypothetical protein